MKKHEAIEADIASYEERIGVVVELSAEMEAEAYYDIRRILARKENILGQWKLLKELVAGRRTRLEKNLTLQKIFQDMVYMIDWMEDTQVVQAPPLGVLIRYNENMGHYNERNIRIKCRYHAVCLLPPGLSRICFCSCLLSGPAAV